ncbi:MAG: ureidoglycolate hydrolase [Geminicoccaceae bacterium]|nr:MAG: ureidoglycolate hydrolase [Geminicoccaceae bacterium]
MHLSRDRLALEPLDADAFAPFGTLLDLPLTGGAGRWDRVANVQDLRGGLETNVALIRAAAEPLPATIARLERHPHSSQLFVPVGMAGRFLVVVAPDRGGQPDLAQLRAFLCEGARGVVYAPGVWHHPLVSLVPCRFLMLVHEDGGAEDTLWHELATPIPLDGD